MIDGSYAQFSVLMFMEYEFVSDSRPRCDILHLMSTRAFQIRPSISFECTSFHMRMSEGKWKLPTDRKPLTTNINNKTELDTWIEKPQRGLRTQVALYMRRIHYSFEIKITFTLA